MIVIVVSEDQPRPGTHCTRQCPNKRSRQSVPWNLRVQTFKTDKGQEKEFEDFYPTWGLIPLNFADLNSLLPHHLPHFALFHFHPYV